MLSPADSHGAGRRRKAGLLRPADLKGAEIMSAFEEFLRDHPQMAGRALRRRDGSDTDQTFQCTGQ